MKDALTVALVSEVFHDPAGPARLRSFLEEAKRRGAELAVLPELPLHPWVPATREASTPCRLPSGTARAGRP